VNLIVNKELSAGKYKVKWDAQNLPTGIYIYTLKTREFSLSNKMILIR